MTRLITVNQTSAQQNPPKKVPDSCKGTIDTACLFCVAGRQWHEDYKKHLSLQGLRDQVAEVPEYEVYRFGNGGTLPSNTRATVPIVICGKVGKIVYSVVYSPTLSLLIGRDFLEPAKVDICIHSNLIKIGRDTQKLVKSQAGHPAIMLQPESWKTSKDACIVAADLPPSSVVRDKVYVTDSKGLLNSVRLAHDRVTNWVEATATPATPTRAASKNEAAPPPVRLKAGAC